MKKNISVCFIAMLLAIVIALYGCEKVPEAEKTAEEPLHIAALKGPTGMGLAYVIAEDEADTVELFDAPDALSAKFISGEVDIAAVPVNLASILYNKTQGDTMVLAVNTLGVLYVLDTGDTLYSIADLAEKTLYATGQGSTPEYVLNYLLDKNGITGVEIAYVGEHAVLAGMVVSGEAELAMLPEPQVSATLAKNAEARIALDLTEEWNKVTDTTLVQGVYITKRSVYEEKRDAIESFMALAEDSAIAVNTREDAADTVAAAGIVPSAAIAKKAIPGSNIVCIRGEEMKDSVSAMLEVLYAAQPSSVGGALPGEDFYAS